MSIALKDIARGEDIEAESLRIIDSEVPEPRPYQGAQWAIVRRMIHTTADFELLSLVRFHPRAVEAGLEALGAGCLIVTDTEMARAGMPRRRLDPLGCEARCLVSDPAVLARAQAEGSTRARAAVDLAVETLVREGRPAIWAIGNAPTALIRLLEHVRAGRTAPALIIGMPVGFVNAAESKALLMAQEAVPYIAPYIAIEGRKGGSALAACAVNALAILAREARKENA